MLVPARGEPRPLPRRPRDTAIPRDPQEYAGEPPEELREFDYFHELIMIDEISRCGSGGVLWGLFGGLSIGLPPVLNFGSQYLKQKVARDCLKARARAARTPALHLPGLLRTRRGARSARRATRSFAWPSRSRTRAATSPACAPPR